VPRRSRLCLVVLLAALGCRQPLHQAQPSPEALAQAVLTALEQRDAGRLRELAVTEPEFRDLVWPELPAARPERNLTFEYVWNDLHVKSEVGLAGVLAEHGGQGHTFVRVEFAGETTQYRTYLVRRDAIVIVRDRDQREQRVRLFGSVLERDEGVKVFSYVVD
jgi:hypothetical protein